MHSDIPSACVSTIANSVETTNVAPLNILAISGRYANRTHGTGVQLLDFYRAFGPGWRQVCWTHEAPTGEEPPGTINFDNSWSRKWPFRMGAEKLTAIQSKLGLTSRKRGRLDPRHLQKILGEIQDCNVAHVIVSSENGAATANQLLDQLAIPAVAHWMDFEHIDGLDACVEVHRLNSRASAVYAISEPLANALNKYCRREIPIVRCGRQMAAPHSRQGHDPNLVQIVMLGSLTLRRGMEEIRRFLSAMEPCLGDMRCVLNFLGSEVAAKRLSDSLSTGRVSVRYRGYVTDSQLLDSIVAEMDLALLPGPDGDPRVSPLARYSVPSRIGDYLCLGLPIATWVHGESATAEFLRPGVGDFVFHGKDGADCARMVIEHLKSCPATRSDVSKHARSFAQLHLDNARVIARLEEDLRHACSGANSQGR